MKEYSKENFIINGHICAEKRHYNSKVTPHCHEFFELEYIISGKGIYCIDGIEYDIEDKTLFFMTPANFHSVDMKDTRFYNVMFSADSCDIRILSKLFSSAPAIIGVDDSTHFFLCGLLEELCKNYDNTEYASLILETLVSKINILSENVPAGNVSADIRSTELFILERFRSELTLSDAATHAMLSESHFSRKFARETGRGFKEYLNSVRYDHAKKLLVYSDMTVMQICAECGFGDYPNFVRRFGERFGESPTDFRRRSIQKEKIPK